MATEIAKAHAAAQATDAPTAATFNRRNDLNAIHEPPH